jgi:hypothetical protein
MQEAGATSRTVMQEEGATARTGMQVQGQLKMQAADLAAKDRQMAGAEKARRETQEWETGQNSIRLKLEKELENNRMEWEREKHLGDVERMEAQDKRALDITKLTLAVGKHESDVRQNVLLKQMDMVGQSMTADEKKKSYYEERRRLADERSTAYNKTKTRTIDKLESDARIAFRPGFVGTAPVATLNQSYGEALAAEGSKISVTDFLSPGMTSLRLKAMRGELSPEDIRITWAVTDGYADNLEDRANQAKTDPERKFWLHAKSEMLNNKTKILQQLNEETAISGSKQTFGMIIRDGIWDIEGLSPGQSYQLALDEGKSWDEYMVEVKGGIEPFSLPEIELGTPEGAELASFIRNLYSTGRANQLEMEPSEE